MCIMCVQYLCLYMLDTEYSAHIYCHEIVMSFRTDTNLLSCMLPCRLVPFHHLEGSHSPTLYARILMSPICGL